VEWLPPDSRDGATLLLYTSGWEVGRGGVDSAPTLKPTLGLAEIHAAAQHELRTFTQLDTRLDVRQHSLGRFET